jgi:hypothetical protein
MKSWLDYKLLKYRVNKNKMVLLRTTTFSYILAPEFSTGFFTDKKKGNFHSPMVYLILFDLGGAPDLPINPISLL